MKKIYMLSVVLTMMAFITTVNVEARPGGLSDITIDKTIKDCPCPPCCPEPVVEPKIEPPPPPPPPPPAPVKEKVTITLNVQFDTDKTVVKDKYYDDIKRVADFMKEYPDSTAAIEGHTDSVDTDEYNQKLSERRANSVRQYLIDKLGIDGSRLTAAGYGESKPIASNDTEEGRQKNRRVEAVLEAIRIVQ